MIFNLTKVISLYIEPCWKKRWRTFWVFGREVIGWDNFPFRENEMCCRTKRVIILMLKIQAWTHFLSEELKCRVLETSVPLFIENIHLRFSEGERIFVKSWRNPRAVKQTGNRVQFVETQERKQNTKNVSPSQDSWLVWMWCASELSMF
jgi:hypothetical protein